MIADLGRVRIIKCPSAVLTSTKSIHIITLDRHWPVREPIVRIDSHRPLLGCTAESARVVVQSAIAG